MISVGPVMLSAAFTVSPGAKIEPETSRLQNPFRSWMALDEIRFTNLTELTLSRSAGGGIYIPASNALVDARFNLGMRLKYGTEDLTSDFIPLGLFAPTLSRLVTSYTAVPLSGDPADGADPTNYTVSWRLPKPLLIPPSGLVTPCFFHRGARASAAVPITGRISYLGRALPSTFEPKALRLPWVSWFEGGAIAANGEESSSETELHNPFSTPLHVQRFIGKIESFDSGGTGYAEFRDGQPYSTEVNTIRVRMTDTAERRFVKDLTPFNHLFNGTSDSWDAPVTLPPKHAVYAVLDYASVPSSITDADRRCAISMVGWRNYTL